MGDEPVTFQSIEQALAAVQRTLDALTARGDHAAAFDVAKAQYAASIRSSWPGNLSSLAAALEKVSADESLHLSSEERGELRRAVDVFRRVRHP